ncbi:MAG: hypothetical protein BXU00_02830 [Candidatus Nanoclepta minutus]|uniref:Glycosyl transferase family 1 domain-containing protein n=1 Tax=Candidatus Nanoclepta minutus TaxID=1940235 RepID=A0A397WRE6_9ARCH|nr:MAG: hypothetical protein BXU00_02830 [Candidatus Nanoclepta minutus]
MIKVRVESLGKLDSSYYKYLFLYPPDGVIYLNKIKDTLITSSRKFISYLKVKRIIYSSIGRFPIFKIRKVSSSDLDLYHTSHLFLFTDKPYVTDFEHYYIFFFTHYPAYSGIGKIIIKKLFKQKNLKYLLPWTYEAYNTIPEEIRKDPKIREKLKVIYPAVPAEEYVDKDFDKIRLLFVARYFYAKGGSTVLKVFENLNKRYDIEMFIVTPKKWISDKILKKYNFIKWLESLTDEGLRNLYRKSHIYVYPGYSDSFGFTILEAMSYGNVVVTSEGFARREIIENEKTGYIIKRDKDEIKKYTDVISSLIENTNLIKEISLNAWKEIKYGKFSIGNRNKSLKEIYESSIKY